MLRLIHRTWHVRIPEAMYNAVCNAGILSEPKNGRIIMLNPPIHLSIHLSIHPYVRPSIPPSIPPPKVQRIHQFIHPLIHPLILPFFDTSSHPSIRFSICESTRPSNFLYPFVYASSIHLHQLIHTTAIPWSRDVCPGRLRGRDPQILGRRCRGGSQEDLRGVVDGLRNIIISYHVQNVCSKMVTLEEK